MLNQPIRKLLGGPRRRILSDVTSFGNWVAAAISTASLSSSEAPIANRGRHSLSALFVARGYQRVGEGQPLCQETYRAEEFSGNQRARAETFLEWPRYRSRVLLRKLQLPEAGMVAARRRLRRLRLTSCNCASSGPARGETGRGSLCGAGSGLGILEWEVVTVMSVFPRKGTCVPPGMYSFIYSCGDIGGDGRGLKTFLLLKIKNAEQW